MARQVGVSLPPEIEAAVEAWRASLVVPPSRSAAITVLVREGLKALAPETLAGKGD
jgi:hypothetical protein